MALTIQRIRQPGPLLDLVHQQLLVTSFPVNERVDPADLASAVAAGHTEVFVGRDRIGEPVATVIGDWYPTATVMLLAYLAVTDHGRGQGWGSQLLDHAVTQWRTRLAPNLILAEVERPDRHAGSAEHGNPRARLRFYERHGARALDLPHFQPALGPTTEPVPGLLLTALHVTSEGTGPDTETVAGAPVLAFLRRYLGATADTPAGRRLLDAADRPGGIRLVPLEAWRRIPAGDPQR